MITVMVWPAVILGVVCLYFGLTLFGIWYMSVRSRHWTRLNGVVVSKYESVSRSHSEGDEYVQAGLKVDNHFPAVSVQICRNDELMQLHFPNPGFGLDIGEKVIVCVHPWFPRLFYCKYEPEVGFSLLRFAGKIFSLTSALTLLAGSVVAFSIAFGLYWF